MIFARLSNIFPSEAPATTGCVCSLYIIDTESQAQANAEVVLTDETLADGLDALKWACATAIRNAGATQYADNAAAMPDIAFM